MSQIPPFFNNDTRETPMSIQEWMRQVRDDESDFLTKSVAGNSTVNLTTNESHSHILVFTGVLTGNINVIYANIKFKFIVTNSTTGAFTLTVKTAAGTGVTVAQGKSALLYCNAINVVRAGPDT